MAAAKGVFCLLVFYHFAGLLAFRIPNAKLEIVKRGFQVSIPDEPGIKYVAFNVNVNRAFKSFEPGVYSAQVEEPVNGRWTFSANRQLNEDDVVHVWIGLQHNKMIYQAIQDPISVKNVNVKDGDDHAFKPITIAPATTPSQGTIFDGIEDDGVTCSPTITIVPNRQVCKGELIFEDLFDDFNADYWKHEIRIPYSADDAEFVLYNDTVELSNGLLKIEPHLYNKNIRRGKIDLGTRCTGTNIEKECSIEAKTFYVLPPVISGRINTKDSFNFKYGRVEIRAKLPIGDWLVPLLLLEPVVKTYGSEHYNSGEMRIAYVRGNRDLYADGEIIDGRRLFGGALLTQLPDLRHKSMASITMFELNGQDEHFGERFHTYTMLWTDKAIVLSVDGHVYGHLDSEFSKLYDNQIWKKGEHNAPFDQLFYITLGVSAGGHGDFPNNVNKPWENTSPKATVHFWNHRGRWHPTWSSPELLVDYVRVYAV